MNKTKSNNILQIANLLRKINHKKQLIEQKSNILVSISGGQDSIFLLFCLSFLQFQIYFTLKIVWCNHFWQSDSFYTTLHLTKSAQAFSFPIIGFIPLHIASPSPLTFRSLNRKAFAGFASFTRAERLGVRPKFKKKRSFSLLHSKNLGGDHFRSNSLFGHLEFIPKLILLQIRAKPSKPLGVRFIKKKENFGDTCKAKHSQTPKDLQAERIQAVINSFFFRCTEKKLVSLCESSENDCKQSYALLTFVVIPKKLSFAEAKPAKTTKVFKVKYGAKKVRPYKATLCRGVKGNFCSNPQGFAGVKVTLFEVRDKFYSRKISKTSKTYVGDTYKTLFCKSHQEVIHFFLQQKLQNRSFYKNFLTKRFTDVLSESTARNWRHITIERVCTFYNSPRCIYGHTLSDRVETILFNIIRGAGRRGATPLQWKREHSSFSYNKFYPCLEQIKKNTHVNFF